MRTDAIADVFLHAQKWPPTPDLIAALPAIAANGQPSHKLFFPADDFGANIHDVVRLIEAARDAGVITMVHCEDAAIVAAAQKRLAAQARTSLSNYGASRPVAAEVAATAQAAAICESTGAPLHVVHLSAARALEACQRSRTAGAPLFVETRPARIFGLYPRKGVIRVGANADIVIWDPSRQGTVTAEADVSNADYSVYEGWKVTGWPIATIRRGEVVFDAGRFTGRRGTGQLVSRERWHR